MSFGMFTRFKTHRPAATPQKAITQPVTQRSQTLNSSFMALTFRGTSIPGIHSDLVAPSPDLQRTATVSSGLRGESELVGKTGGGEFEVEIHLFNTYSTAAAVYTAIENLRRMQGKNGRLAESGSRTFSEDNVTLIRVDLIRGPMPCLGSSTKTGFSGWMANLRLIFRRLKP